MIAALISNGKLRVGHRHGAVRVTRRDAIFKVYTYFEEENDHL